MLPKRNGIDLCRDIRTEGLGTPILMLTARTDTSEKVAGLKLGADDYLTKPFDMLELMARIEALLRRAPMRTGPAVYQFGNLRVETRSSLHPELVSITRSGKPIYLSIRESELLRYFMEHAGTVLSRERLLHEVWGFESGASTRTVDVHVVRLRQKLENDPKNPEVILSVHNIGYGFAG